MGVYSLACGCVYGKMFSGDQCIVRVPCWGCGSPTHDVLVMQYIVMCQVMCHVMCQVMCYMMS